MPSVVVLGGRNLGGAVLDAFLSDGWSAAGVSLTERTAEETRARGALAYTADVRDPAALADVLAEAREHLGDLTVVVNAGSLARRRPAEPFHGGPLADATDCSQPADDLVVGHAADPLERGHGAVQCLLSEIAKG